MTISEAISTLRGKIRTYDDDSIWQDEYLYNVLLDATSVVFSRYKEKWYKISDLSFDTYGVKLQMVGADQFPCEDIEHCLVLESVFNIPTPLVSRNRLMLKVYSGNMELPQYNSANVYDDYLKDKPSWEFVNGKLRIHNNKKLKAITVKTIPSNPMEWIDKKYCPETNTIEYFDLDSLTFNLLADRKFAMMSYDLALQALGIHAQEIIQEKNVNAQH